jgi:ribulose-phosphate 3-epimerase
MPADTALTTLKGLTPTISVGILTADLLNLGSQVALLEETGVGLVHFDVMDGVFCPMMTVGPGFIKAVKTPLLKDVHLMIQDPMSKIADFAAAGADIITVHVEGNPHIHRILQALGKLTNANDPERGIVRGIGLNPGTPLEMLEPLLDEADMVTLLAVNPGWSGQEFIQSTGRRVSRVREMIAWSGRDILLCVDGGVKRDNVAEVAAMGADIIVTGSAVFDGKAHAENARFMLSAVKR